MEGVTPVMDINGNHHDGYNAWIWIIVLFALMGGWGFNRNNGNDAAATFANGAITREAVSTGFDYQTLNNGIRGVQNGLCDGFFTQAQGTANLEKTVMQGNNALGTGLAENRFAMQSGFCDVNRNIDAVRAEAYRNTCDITTAIHDEAEKTRALITANTIQELRDKLADRDRDLQSASFQLSQVAQSAQLVNTLLPFPRPAYIVNSPYTSSGTTTTTTA